MSRPLAVVTGGSSGIGKSIVSSLTREGWRVLLSGRDPSRLKSAACVPENILVPGDIGNPETIDAIRDAVVGSGSPLRLLVNNAGIAPRQKFIETSDESWLEQFTTNVMGPVRLTRSLLDLFVENESSIINISSTLGIKPISDLSAYSATKAALNSMTQSWALEFAPAIRVNAICPGLVDTPIQPFYGESDSSPARREAHSLQPLGRMGKPEDVSEMVVYLASDKAQWITGSIFTIDGGISLRS